MLEQDFAGSGVAFEDRVWGAGGEGAGGGVGGCFGDDGGRVAGDVGEGERHDVVARATGHGVGTAPGCVVDGALLGVVGCVGVEGVGVREEVGGDWIVGSVSAFLCRAFGFVLSTAFCSFDGELFG